MILRVPSYYKDFKCIADKCQDSCCIGWEIDIDEDTFTYYKSVEGSFGDRLRSHMVTADVNSFTLEENGWCPFLNQNKLCDICIKLGEEALSEVCTEFPRFTIEYENVREKVLSLSCEEVGRLIFSTDQKITWEERQLTADFETEMYEEDIWETQEFCEEGCEAEEEQTVSAEQLEQVRKKAVDILQNREKPVFLRAVQYLSYCSRMQQELYGGLRETEEFAEPMAAGEVRDSEVWAYQEFLARMESYGRLEVLDEIWVKSRQALTDIFSAENYQKAQREFVEAYREREYEYEHLLVYFTDRYFMRAYYDDNILTKAQFAIASVLMIRDMDVARYLANAKNFTLEDRIDTAKIYAKEVEHSEENMEMLAEDFQFEEVFAVERLIGQLI